VPGADYPPSALPPSEQRDMAVHPFAQARALDRSHGQGHVETDQISPVIRRAEQELSRPDRLPRLQEKTGSARYIPG